MNLRPGAPTVVALTATVTPPADVHKLRLRDPTDRLREYDRAISAWRRICSVSGWHLLVVENSGFDGWRSDDVMTVLAAPVDDDRQKGRGEARQIGHALRHVQERHGDDAALLKVTGRLVIANIGAILQVDPGSVQASLRTDVTYCDSRVFALGARYLTCFDGMERDVDEPRGVYLEHVVARRMWTAIGAGATFLPWPRLPRIEGTSGSMGLRYDTRRARAQIAVHDIARMLLRRRSIVL